ncbi:hypothetical protein [Marinobacter flavimaris]|uniref:hypothetical protein n=1 Tax=Marinobacter flavimaris TaxID=262076 RepID=UPI0011B0C93F|nr:hypothetical protein [Marinobacter flavimaris]
MSEFLTEHASAVFTLAGGFGGAILSFLASWFLKRRDYELSIWERLMERRLAAFRLGQHLLIT